jgi:hypothetical protein
MDGLSRSSAAGQRRVHVVRVALAAVIALVGLVVLPGTASAKAGVTPLLDCSVVNKDGSWTAVFGYDNPTAATVTIPKGSDNKVTPVTYGAPQPITFKPGVHHGAFSVTVTRGAGVMWHLDGQNLAARAGTAPPCPPSTELPEEGNGTGPAIVLVAAGVVGAVAVLRVRRRAPGAAGAQAGAEHDDA